MEFQTLGLMVASPSTDIEAESEINSIEKTPGYGKAVCEKLKHIRNEAAKKANVDYVSEECPYMEECTGPCPKCEKEARDLYRLLYGRKN